MLIEDHNREIYRAGGQALDESGVDRGVSDDTPLSFFLENRFVQCLREGDTQHAVFSC